MAKYDVIIREIEIYNVEVDASNEEEAVELAYLEIETQLGKDKWHNDSDSEAEVYEIGDI